mmetsp:Transcript_6448/g.18275  ORF Transcript_6448/g.18275 Transcript_6448/m.18275 type:complete len:486 (+) Transcript_6448:89-1546(+)|eukprot:CAMPEP_0119127040 /NCGR_PEP_ID=MMETSP1310-20130426/5736_1 /TAXON_ID=464262 /ORGANISM="Genus nov. species nov., Strain RCC2339" /LENGTH=485 /DNA_ID=CAMNT_0007117259 /DNA_START=64 /DNA_END=1521 /DNA_ORIENTATION=-
MDSDTRKVLQSLSEAGVMRRDDLDGVAHGDSSTVGQGRPMHTRIQLPPLHFVHLQNVNTLLRRTVVGPRTFTTTCDEVVCFGPTRMVIVPPDFFCVVKDPVDTGDATTRKEVDRVFNGEAGRTGSAAVKLKHGDLEIRFHRDPFPLFPGESLAGGAVFPLPFVPENVALHLRAMYDFAEEGEDGRKRCAGEEWLVRGPCLYRPHRWVKALVAHQAKVLRPGQAVHLQAVRDLVDSQGVPRVAGEEWMYRGEGAFIPDVSQRVVGVRDSVVLSDRLGLWVRAERAFYDEVFGKSRVAGEEWLVTAADTPAFLPVAEVTVFARVQPVTLKADEYCTITNPRDSETGTLLYGRVVVRRGIANLFPSPGEEFSRVRKAIVLDHTTAVALIATQTFVDLPAPVSREEWENQSRWTDEEKVAANGVRRKAGERWLVYGPREFVPPPQAEFTVMSALLPVDPLQKSFFFTRMATKKNNLAHAVYQKPIIQKV